MTYHYVTDGAWGTGTGAPFSDPAILDEMWWETAEAIADLQAFMAAPGIPTITGLSVDGSTFSLLMSSGGPFGPYLLPVPKFRYRSDLNSGAWAADSDYLSNDTFTQGGTSYCVQVSHHSDLTTFDAEATDGLGHKLYGVLIPYAPLALVDLTDVVWNTAGPAEGDLIQFIGGVFTNVALSELTLSGLIAFSDLTDVAWNTAGPNDGEIVQYSGGIWTNVDLATALSELLALANLSDVSWNTAGPAEGEILQFVGAAFTNVALADLGLTFSDIGGVATPTQMRAPSQPLAATTGTVSFDPTIAEIHTVTPTGDMTIDAASAIVGYVTIVITTSGTSSRTLTFGTNFKTTGTLATGTVSGKTFTITFAADGTNLCEVSRTTAMS